MMKFSKIYQYITIVTIFSIAILSSCEKQEKWELRDKTMQTSTIQIKLQSPSSFTDWSGNLIINQGSPITIDWHGNDIPKNTSIGFAIAKVDPHQIGPSGALLQRAENISGRDHGVFFWDGQSFWCNQTDRITTCKKELEPGNYYMKAFIYDQENASLVASFVQYPKHVNIIVETKVWFTVSSKLLDK
mgnify:FL=1